MLKTIQREKNIVIQEAFSKKSVQFFNEKMPQIQTQTDENTRKFLILKILCNFCLYFEKTWWLRMLKTFKKD